MADILTPIGKVTITPRGEYDSGATYERLDLVTSGGSSYLYINLASSAGSALDNTEFWLMVAEKGESIAYIGPNEPENYTFWVDDSAQQLPIIRTATTSARNDLAYQKSIGDLVFDTTLGIPIWYNGTNWVNSSGSIS